MGDFKSLKNLIINPIKITKKHNNDKPLPNETEDIKEWLIENREKMNAINIKDKYGEDIDDFFSIFDKKSKEMNK